jgi:rubrerythrin
MGAVAEVVVGRLEDGTPYFAPLGELPYDADEDRVQCHLCGRWFRAIAGSHLQGVHGWREDDYREAFGLERSHGLVAKGTAERLAESFRRRLATEPQLRAVVLRQRQRMARGELRWRGGGPQRLEHARKSAANVAAVYEERVAARSAQARRDRQRDAQRVAGRLGFPGIAAYLGDRLQSGFTLRAIASETGRDVSWVKKLAIEHRLYRPKPRPDGPSRWQAAAADHGFATVTEYLRERRHERGWTLEQIAHEAGLTAAAVLGRLRREGLPTASPARVFARSLAAKHPHLLAEWHGDRNRGIDPRVLAAGSARRVWWRCRRCGCEWAASIVDRGRGTGCPRCARRTVPRERSLAILRPELAAELHPSRNAALDPYALGASSNLPVWWRCSSCGFEWQQRVSRRTRRPGGSPCPACVRRERAADG